MSDRDLVVAAANGLDIRPRGLRWTHLSLCVLDAVFSINATYRSTTNVCHRYAAHAHLVPLTPPDALLPVGDQQRLDDFVADVGDDEQQFARAVLKNKGLTSTRSGVLKAAAARQYAEVLLDHGVRTLDDTTRAIEDLTLTVAIDHDLRAIKGHGQGARRDYFWMLVGDDHRVKPDRMVFGWLRKVLDRDVSYAEVVQLLGAAASTLGCTPWELDHAIWQTQRRRRG